MLKSTPAKYGTIVVSLHWLTAILIIALLATGFQSESAAVPAAKAAFLRVHVPAAVLVLLLTVFRAIWWWRVDTRPATVEGMPAWQAPVAKLTHFALYGAIFVMLGSGIALLAASGAAPAIFAATDLPEFNDFTARKVHGLGALTLVGLLTLHAGAAFYHHFVRRDGMLWRMWFGN